MSRIRLLPSPARAIAPVLLLAIASSAAAQKPTAGAAPNPTTAPRATVAQGPKLPDLAFGAVIVANKTHYVTDTAQTLVVDHVFPPPSSQGARQAKSPCDRSFTFSLILLVRNIGQATFVPKGSAQAVGVNVGPWNAAKDLTTIAVNGTQSMSFNVTLPPGNYTLDALIDLHGQVAEANPANDKLNWPLKVTCELRSSAAVAPAPIKKP
jgi:hypothetical protein